LNKSDLAKDKTTTVTDPRTGASYSYNYADLSAVVEYTRSPLTDAGLAITHSMIMIDGQTNLWTRLLHSSGEYLGATYPIPINWIPEDKKNKQQMIGTIITYAKRYSSSAILNIASDDDDDANSADGNDANIYNKKAEIAPMVPADTAFENAKKYCVHVKSMADQVNTSQEVNGVFNIHKDKLLKLQAVYPLLYNEIFDFFADKQAKLAKSL